jgi:beta-lactamase class A
MQRVMFLTGAAASMSAPLTPFSFAYARDSNARLAELERRSGGRLGLFAFDSAQLRQIAYRSRERFPMCSTFKVLLVSAVLSKIDGGEEQLQRRIPLAKADLLSYAPISAAHVDVGYMTIEQLCAAAIEYSDNTAANLLLSTIGGPIGVTAYARKVRDTVTRLDRVEPALNTAIPGDPRDTTTPEAMAQTLQRIVLGNALSTQSRWRLNSWMLGCRTGLTCLRAGIPAGWIVADKTGSGERGTRNDTAVLRPPHRPPIVVAAYLTNTNLSTRDQNATLAEVGKIVSETFA